MPKSGLPMPPMTRMVLLVVFGSNTKFCLSDRLRGEASDGEDLAHRARATASGNGARREQRSQLAHDLRRPRALVASDLDGDDGGEDARRTRKPPGGPTAGATGEGAGGQIGGPAGRGGPGAHPP